MEVYGTAVQNWVCEFASGIAFGATLTKLRSDDE